MKCKMRVVVAVALGVAMLLFIITAGAVGAGEQVGLGPGDLEFDTVVVRACEDTTLNAWYPQSNYSASATLTLRSQDGSSPLLKFDFGALPYPQDMAVASASLRLFVQSASNGLPAQVSAYAVHRPWVAGEATWYRADRDTVWDGYGCNGTPGDRAAAGTPEQELAETGDWVTLDITDLVRGWLQGALPNNGLLLKATARGSVGYTLFSADYANGAYRPSVEIDYALIPTPQPTITPTATPVMPGLEVDKVGPVGPLKPDERTITYNVTVRNTGTALASGVVLTDVLPLGTNYGSCTEGGVYDAEEHVIVWRDIDLEQGESLTMVVHLDLAAWVREMGNIVNVVRASCPACPGVAEDYWETIIVAPTPTPTATPVRMYLPLQYRQAAE